MDTAEAINRLIVSALERAECTFVNLPASRSNLVKRGKFMEPNTARSASSVSKKSSKNETSANTKSSKIKRGSKYKFIKTKIVGQKKNVGLICLNRPSESNALSASVMDEVAEQLAKFGNNTSIGAIVLTGSESAFALGADIKKLISMNLASCYNSGFSDNWNQIVKTKKPIIAAVNGYAFGEGCELAMSCDIVYASDNAEFGHPETLMGTIPGNGGTQRLPRTIGKSLAMEMCLTGDHINAKEALKRGLVSKVFPSGQLLAETVKLAEKIANNSPLINIMAKESVNRAFETTLQEGLLFERRMFHTTFATNDRKEGMIAFVEKRNPKWISS